MLEKLIQEKIIKKLKKYGILALKVESQSHTGLPDLLCTGPGGPFMIEVKQERGRLSATQKVMIRHLQQHGMRVYTCYGLEGLAEIVDQEKTPGEIITGGLRSAKAPPKAYAQS